MPYGRVSDLPVGVRNVLPVHAQVIYKEAFNHAWNEYKDPAKRRDGGDHEQVAHRVAWGAVKNKYTKSDDNKWHLKN